MWTRSQLEAVPETANRASLLTRKLAGRKIILMTCHRRESWGTAMIECVEAIRRIAGLPDVAVVFPLHPNSAVYEAFAFDLSGFSNVILVDSLPYPDFIRLIMLSDLILTDSGGVQEEAATLGKPILVMRNKTERTEALADTWTQIVGTCATTIFCETFKLIGIDRPSASERNSIQTNYGTGDSALIIKQHLR